MNITDAHHFAQSGFTLNSEERVVLKNSLAQKKNEEKFLNVSLFAKITGVKSDYYLAHGTNTDPFSKKYFYWLTCH